MKKSYLLFILTLATITACFAQTCTVSEFTSQQSVDDFSSQHPGCKIINGDLKISGSDITNLNGLAGIEQVTGTLNIFINPALSDISALSSLTQVAEVNIEQNNLLVNLTGLEGLTGTGGNLRIVYNNSLNDLSALANIAIVNGFLSIGGNQALTSLSGLENLIQITGEVSLGLNASLTNFDGLSGLKTIGGYLYIADSPALTSLTGLMNLTSISGYLWVRNNDALTSLSGLDNINLTGFAYVLIENSNVLSFCGVKSLCYYSRLGGGTFEGNAVGCSSIDEVRESGACQIVFPVDLISFEGKASAEGNVLTWSTATETNNTGFDVERSNDSKTFTELGFVKGNETSNQLNEYTFTDAGPERVTYYRLKQIDTDTKFTYSKIIVVQNKLIPEAVSIFPNPSNGELHIKAKNLHQKYVIRNLSGVTVMEANQIPSSPIDTKRIPNGLYNITVGEKTFKVMVMN